MNQDNLKTSFNNDSKINMTTKIWAINPHTPLFDRYEFQGGCLKKCLWLLLGKPKFMMTKIEGRLKQIKGISPNIWIEDDIND